MIPDHPDIRSALLTGYPSDTRQQVCPRCGEDIGSTSYEIEGENRCRSCFEDWLLDYLNTNPDDVAKALSVPVHWEG